MQNLVHVCVWVYVCGGICIYIYIYIYTHARRMLSENVECNNDCGRMRKTSQKSHFPVKR